MANFNFYLAKQLEAGYRFGELPGLFCHQDAKKQRYTKGILVVQRSTPYALRATPYEQRSTTIVSPATVPGIEPPAPDSIAATPLCLSTHYR